MRLSFYKKCRTIYFSLYHNRKRVRLSTGIILPEGSDFKDLQFIGNHSDELNEFLSHKRTEILSIWRQNNDLDLVKSMYKPEYFKLKQNSSYDLIFMLEERVKDMLNEKKYTNKTLNGYVNSVRRISDYTQNTGNRLNVLNCIMDPRDTMIDRKAKTDEFLSFFRGFDSYLAEKKYVMASRFTLITQISGLLNMISKQYGISLPKIPTPVLKQNPVTTLHPDFVAKFVSDQFGIYNGLTPDERYAWEIAATILVTTLRLSDAKSLSMSDLQDREGCLFISKMNKKTSQYSYLPLPKRLSDIYKANYEQFGSIYTTHTPELNLPAIIRRVFSLIDEMHQPITIKKIGVYGEETSKTIPTFQAVQPHMLRKTAITTMIYMGVSERHIKFASGHSANSTSFERYVGHVEKMFQSEFTNYYEKLGI